MKADEELLAWFSRFVKVSNLGTDFRDGTALLGFVHSLTGVEYPHTKNPTTTEEFHRNVTVSFMAILNIFADIQMNCDADDIVCGNIEKTRELLDNLANDEWEIIAPEEMPPKEPFDISSCDLSTYPITKIKVAQNAIRRYLASRTVRTLKKKKTYRDNVAKEILETEETYVAGLQTLVEVYYNQLQFKADMAEQTGREPILSKEEIQLKERLSIWSSSQVIADIFVSVAPSLAVYTQYCNNYEHACAAVDQARKKKPLFVSHLERCAMTVDQMTNYFESLLITPIQRGPRYILLLRELLSRTDKDHPDYSDLKKAILMIEEQLASVNQKLREAQASAGVIAMQEKLVGDDIPNFVRAGRYYRTEGTFRLCNLDSAGKEFQTIHLFFLNDCIIYTKKQNSKMYRFRNSIPLGKDTRLKSIPDMGVVQNAFNVISREKTLSLVCESPEEKKKWMDRILSLQQELVATLPHQEKSTDSTGGLSVSATITGTKVLYDVNNKSFTCYSILVTPTGEDTSYTVYRRYREFDSIWRKLRKKYPQCNLMQLPKKHFIGNMKKDIVESRQIMLETFLEDVLTKPEIRRSSELFIFLQPSDNYAEAMPSRKKQMKTTNSSIEASMKNTKTLFVKRKSKENSPAPPATPATPPPAPTGSSTAFIRNGFCLHPIPSDMRLRSTKTGNEVRLTRANTTMSSSSSPYFSAPHEKKKKVTERREMGTPLKVPHDERTPRETLPPPPPVPDSAPPRRKKKRQPTAPPRIIRTASCRAVTVKVDKNQRPQGKDYTNLKLPPTPPPKVDI